MFLLIICVLVETDFSHTEIYRVMRFRLVEFLVSVCLSVLIRK